MSETCESRERNLPRSKSLVEPLVDNPFIHRINLTTADKIQIGLMTVFVLPIRLIFIGFFLVLGWIFARITLFGQTSEDLKKPMDGWRRKLARPVRFFARCIMFLCGFHYIRVKGKQSLCTEAPILCCGPHSSYFDIFIMFVLRELPSGVSRVENGQVPFLGTLTCFTQPVFVSREDPNSRQNTIKEITRRAESGGAWPQMIIFPEGTCTNRTCLIAFKPGAFIPGAPVQPVCLRYGNKLDTVTWTWDGPGAWTVFWYTLCQFNNSLEIEFLDVHTPTEEEKKDVYLFARNVRDKMAAALKIPTTDHTFEDCRLMLYASKIDFPAASGLIEFHKISKRLGMSFDSTKILLKKFTEIAQENKGQITLEEFATYLELPVSDALKEMFEVYDRDGSGTIDFREYVIGCHLVARPANTEQTIKFAFEVFDSGNKGYITESELCEILQNAFGMDEVDVKKLFEQVDQDSDGKIVFEEFKTYAEKRPEYAKLFMAYQELQSKKVECVLDSQPVNGTAQGPVDSVHDKVKAE